MVSDSNVVFFQQKRHSPTARFPQAIENGQVGSAFPTAPSSHLCQNSCSLAPALEKRGTSCLSAESDAAHQHKFGFTGWNLANRRRTPTPPRGKAEILPSPLHEIVFPAMSSQVLYPKDS